MTGAGGDVNKKARIKYGCFCEVFAENWRP